MIMAIFIGGIGATIYATWWVYKNLLWRRSKAQEKEQDD
jgi:hypothetical protein